MIERTYNVPLRSGFRNTAKYKKTKKAITTLKEFLSRHMKSDKILIGKNLNQYLWKNGIKNPPHHVKITVIKEDDGTVKAELLGFKYEHMKKAEREALKEKKKEKNKEETKAEDAKNEETIKEEQKTEIIEAKEKKNKTKKPAPKKKSVKKN
ncbi:MAG: 50S ribosomal protein L31e [Candidatus Woesearchaeota archaeon]